MIIISDCNKDIVIPAGLGDNPGVVYEALGVKSLNGETGDLKIKTVNGNDMLGEGTIQIKGGVETVNGETGDVKIKTVNGQSLMGEGDVPVDVGVETLNGQKGALTLKTVNGNELTGDGNIEIKAGVESVNGETGAVKIKSVNGQSLMGEGDVPVDVGVETLNGQKGDLKIKSVNGTEMLGEGNVTIDTGVETLNGQKGALTLKTVNGNDMLGDGNIEIQAGSDNVIVLDGLTQEQLTALFNKIDKTGPIKEIFEYRSARSFYTYYDDGYPAICMYFLEVTPYKGGNIRAYMLTEDGYVYGLSHSINYPNFLFFNVDNHTDEGADFECGYTGDYHYFLNSTWTSPNGYFLVLKKGIGDSTKFMVLPLTVLCDKEPDTTNIPIRIQFTANEKLYTYLHGDADGKWLFESAKPIGGVQSSEVANIKVLTQSEYDALTTKDENVLYCIKG